MKHCVCESVGAAASRVTWDPDVRSRADILNALRVGRRSLFTDVLRRCPSKRLQISFAYAARARMLSGVAVIFCGLPSTLEPPLTQQVGACCLNVWVTNASEMQKTNRLSVWPCFGTAAYRGTDKIDNAQAGYCITIHSASIVDGMRGLCVAARTRNPQGAPFCGRGCDNCILFQICSLPTIISHMFLPRFRALHARCGPIT